jgi:LuxR family maltose regulon positive regulatory protein
MHSPAHGPLIATKTLPPKAKRTLIERLRLATLADQVESRLLTLVKAPGGFGKTTLAQSWAEALRQRGNLVAWLSLDPDDDEPQRFLHYVCHALQRAHPDIGTTSMATFSHSALGDPAQVLPLLIDEIIGCGEEVFLFLDDFQCITLAAIHELLSFLLRYAPSNLHLVILSRDDTPLALAALRVRHQLLEIDAAQLRFTADETLEFFNSANDAGLTPEDGRRIHSQTDGWAAALRLMSLSQEGKGPQSFAVPAALAGVARSIDGYLCELLEQLPDGLQEFMLQTALPQRFNAALAVALTGCDSAREHLRQLDKRQLLTAFDDDGQWFTYHQLIREHLLQRLQQRGEAPLRALHWCAADWYRAQDMWSSAVRHALDAGANEQACAWIEQCAMPLVKGGDMLTLLGWERQLHTHMVEQPLRLRLAMAWAGVLSLSSDQAPVISRIEAESDQPELQRECWAARAAALALSDEIEQCGTLIDACLRHPVPDTWVHNSIYNVQRYVHLKHGRWADLYAVPDLPYPDNEAARNALSLVYRLTILGLADMLRGGLDQAMNRLRTAMQQDGDTDSAEQMLTALPGGLTACLLYEHNQLAEAEALLATRLGIIGKLAFLDCAMRSFGTAARLALRQGRIERAYALLEQGEQLGMARRWGRMTAAMLLERLQLLLLEGRMTEAQACLQRLRELDAHTARYPDSPMGEVSQFAALGEAHYALHQFRYADALLVLEPLLTELQASQHRFLAVRAGVLLAAAQLGLKRDEQAARTFGATLAMAASGNMMATLLDYGAGIGTLLVQAREQLERSGGDALVLDFVLRVLPEWQGLHGGRQAPVAPAVEALRNPLSPRECGILELIADGNSNKEIARVLGIGPETVKTHLKNIFVKLSVERRTQAVVQAEALGLLRNGRR